jgi:hypothetical protein
MGILLFILVCAAFLFIIVRSGSNKMISYNAIPVHVRKAMQVCILCTQNNDISLVDSAIARIETLIDIYGTDTINERCGVNLHDVLDSMYKYKTSCLQKL